MSLRRAQWSTFFFYSSILLSFMPRHVSAESIFRCVIAGGKIIEVTAGNAGGFIYSFGKAASPELVVKASREAVEVQHWNGFGRYRSYDLRLPSQDTSYKVHFSWDSLDPIPARGVVAGVEVYVREELVADISCSKKHPIVSNIDSILIR